MVYRLFCIDTYQVPIYDICIGLRYSCTRYDFKEGIVNKDKIKALTQPMYYILLSLKEKRHGYEIMQYIDWLTNSRVKVGPGTLYSLLSRFEDDKFIKLVSDNDHKKTYLITAEGNEILNLEIERLGQLLNDAKLVEGGQEVEFQDRK